MSLSEINREKRLYVGSILKRRNAIALLTCDKAFLFSGVRESVEARELAVGRREKKKNERLIQLLDKSSAAHCLLT